MSDTQTLFVYTILFTPLLGGMVFCVNRILISRVCMERDRVICVVEPVHIVQQIHAVEPLAVAESIEMNMEEHVQFALTLHEVQSVHRFNREALYI
jgi:hypothetical protein